MSKKDSGRKTTSRQSSSATQPDTYTNLANGPLKSLVKGAGLPQPAHLRRFQDDGRGQAYLAGPVLVVGRGHAQKPAGAAAGTGTGGSDSSGSGRADTADADAISRLLLDNDFDVHRKFDPAFKYQAIIAVLTGAQDPSELSETALGVGTALRSLAACGRVVTISDAPEALIGSETDGAAHQATARAATAQAITGFTRSLAHESRKGWTANGILLDGELATVGAAGGTGILAPSVATALWFLLSSKSAYVHGQFISVSGANGATIGAQGFATTGERGPLAGKTAVVTGAAKGIGAAIARVLHRDGARVYGVDIPAAGQALAATMNSVSGTAIQLDITAPDAAERIAESVGRPIDILVNNAGITRDKMLANMDKAKWDSVIGVNLLAEMALTDGLTRQGAWGEHPHVVGLASTSGIAGNKGQTNYAAAKAGVIGATRAEAGTFAGLGGSINAVAPGFIETEMTAQMPAVRRQVARRVSSLEQGGLPLDVAETIAFLASDGATGINGTTLRVCGQNIVGA